MLGCIATMKSFHDFKLLILFNRCDTTVSQKTVVKQMVECFIKSFTGSVIPFYFEGLFCLFFPQVAPSSNGLGGHKYPRERKLFLGNRKRSPVKLELILNPGAQFFLPSLYNLSPRYSFDLSQLSKYSPIFPSSSYLCIYGGTCGFHISDFHKLPYSCAREKERNKQKLKNDIENNG